MCNVICQYKKAENEYILPEMAEARSTQLSPSSLARGTLKTKLYLLPTRHYQHCSGGNWFEKQRHRLHTEQASSNYFHTLGSN